MSTRLPTPTISPDNRLRSETMPMQDHPLVRYFTALLAAVSAIIYFMTAFHIVQVVEADIDLTWVLGAALHTQSVWHCCYPLE